MKKFAEKHDLVKIAGIMVLISVLLTWVIPQGYFSGAELTSNDITRVGIFDFFTHGLHYLVLCSIDGTARPTDPGSSRRALPRAPRFD